jgi:hypothetical protein
VPRRIRAPLDSPPPKGYANWSGPLIAKALERGQGHLKLPNGRAITGQSHDYNSNPLPSTSLHRTAEMIEKRINYLI